MAMRTAVSMSCRMRASSVNGRGSGPNWTISSAGPLGMYPAEAQTNHSGKTQVEVRDNDMQKIYRVWSPTKGSPLTYPWFAIHATLLRMVREESAHMR
jgi:hypothetical protein